MGSFKRSLFGYRRSDVEVAIASKDHRIGALERELAAAADIEAELSVLSSMVIERERQIRSLGERLQEANERQDSSIAALEKVSKRLQEIEMQARGQATRIRMKALSEAVELGRRSQEMAVEAKAGNGADADRTANAKSFFEGLVKVEIGPLDDFSQLVGFEDAIGALGASEISVERFSEGRATLSMHLDEPIELLRELEERSPLEFRVRRTADDNLILDVDEDQGEQHAA